MKVIFENGVFKPQEPVSAEPGKEYIISIHDSLSLEEIEKKLLEARKQLFGDLTEEELKKWNEDLEKLS